VRTDPEVVRYTLFDSNVSLGAGWGERRNPLPSNRVQLGAEAREDPTLPLGRGALKSLMRLLVEVLRDRGTWCDVSTSLDLKRIQARVKNEGISFLTITLPTFGADLQKGLDQGYVDRHLFTGFPWKGGLPLFLGGFLDRVFDRASGVLLADPDVDSIQAIRQITLMFAKIELPASERRTRAAFTGYVKCEQEIRVWDNEVRISVEPNPPANRMAHLLDEFSYLSRILWSEPLNRLDREIYDGGLRPRHGPGATAERLSGNRKYEQSEWTERLEYLFPHGDGYLAPSWRYFADLQHVEILEPGSERPVRVISVPKTLKTPRIIAIEPACMQYTQQAILERLVYLLGRPNYPSSWLLGFDDQEPNRQMALVGSLYGALATLDLSEASDRVSNQLVRKMVALHPHVLEGLDVTRSRKADVPGFGVLRLAKYASMGSALCFPIEAMVFTTLVFLGISRALNRRLNLSDIKSYQGQVRVYGDDLIVPVGYVSSIITTLEDFGLRVNRDKSFWAGRFRESCGKEYYAGEDVSIFRVRRVFPTSWKDTPELASLISLRNQSYHFGYWGVSRFLDDEIRSLIRYFPNVLETSPIMGRSTFLGFDTEREDFDLQRPLVRGYVVSAKAPKSNLEGPGALMKFFLKRGDEPFHDKNHLEYYGRPKSVHTKLRWAPPF
jgi:hypothetical protein